MGSAVVQNLIAISIYMLLVVGIGVYFAKKANKNCAT